MNILLATPFQSAHFDSGLFWAAAFSRAGHNVRLWDYRIEPTPIGDSGIDLCLVMKGGFPSPSAWNSPAYCYWPDALGRNPAWEKNLPSYDRVFTCLRPTPEGMIWLPTGWDPTVHYPRKAAKSLDLVFVGTAAPRKAAFLKEINNLRVEKTALYGNGWRYGSVSTEAIYLDDYCETLSRSRISINVHLDEVGVNRRLFESIACTFTLTDLVPGVEEILGPDLSRAVGFRTPTEAQELVRMYLHPSHQSLIPELWAEEREAIKPYTYDAAVKRVLEEVGP